MEEEDFSVIFYSQRNAPSLSLFFSTVVHVLYEFWEVIL